MEALLQICLSFQDSKKQEPNNFLLKKLTKNSFFKISATAVFIGVSLIFMSNTCHRA
jgi:hypothetical protein